MADEVQTPGGGHGSPKARKAASGAETGRKPGRKPKAAGKKTKRGKTGQKGSRARGVVLAGGKVTIETIEELRERLGFDEVDEVDKLMLTAICRRPAITDVELAALVGLERKAVNKRRNRAAFQAFFDAETMDAWAVLIANQKKAALTMVDLLDSDLDIVRQKTAEFFLTPLVKAHTAGGSGGAEGLSDLLAVLDSTYKAKVETGRLKPAGSASTVEAEG